MASYRLFFRASVYQDLERIPGKDRLRILERFSNLAVDPRPRGCEKLATQELYRVRQGQYRILYSIRDDELTVWVVRVGHRGDVYR